MKIKGNPFSFQYMLFSDIRFKIYKFLISRTTSDEGKKSYVGIFLWSSKITIWIKKDNSLEFFDPHHLRSILFSLALPTRWAWISFESKSNSRKIIIITFLKKAINCRSRVVDKHSVAATNNEWGLPVRHFAVADEICQLRCAAVSEKCDQEIPQFLWWINLDSVVDMWLCDVRCNIFCSKTCRNVVCRSLFVDGMKSFIIL